LKEEHEQKKIIEKNKLKKLEKEEEKNTMFFQSTIKEME